MANVGHDTNQGREMDSIESRIIRSCDGIDMNKVAGIAKIARYAEGFESLDWEIQFIEQENPQNGIVFKIENYVSDEDFFSLSVYFWSSGWIIETANIFKGKSDRKIQNEFDKKETNNRFIFTAHLTKEIVKYKRHVNKYR